MALCFFSHQFGGGRVTASPAGIPINSDFGIGMICLPQPFALERRTKPGSRQAARRICTRQYNNCQDETGTEDAFACWSKRLMNGSLCGRFQCGLRG